MPTAFNSILIVSREDSAEAARQICPVPTGLLQGPWKRISGAFFIQVHSQTQAVQSQSQIGSTNPIATPKATAKAIAAMRIASAPAGSANFPVHVRLREGRAVHNSGLRAHDGASNGICWPRYQGASSHAAPCLRVRAREPRTGHTWATSLLGASVHPTHSALHRTGPRPIQGMVEGLGSLRSRTAERPAWSLSFRSKD